MAPIETALKIATMKENDLDANPDAGDRVVAQTTDEQGIDSADRGLQQVFANDRPGKAQHAALRHRLPSRADRTRFERGLVDEVVFRRQRHRRSSKGGVEWRTPAYPCDDS